MSKDKKKSEKRVRAGNKGIIRPYFIKGYQGTQEIDDAKIKIIGRSVLSPKPPEESEQPQKTD